MRRVFIFHDGEVRDRATVERHRASGAPSIRPDGMDPIRSMADGRMYDGKSAYYASVRRAGCEIVGNDKAPFDKRPTHESAGIGRGVGQSISQAIDQLRARS